MVCIKSLILLGLVINVIFSGCEKGTREEERSYGDSLIIVTYHAPAAMNPLTTVSGISSHLIEILFDGLIKIDENLEVRPALASSYETSSDGLRWTFYLRKGVKFHDGMELTAEDVRFTFEEILHSNSINRFTGSLGDIIRTIHIKDRYAVEFILNRPSVFFIHNMDVGILPGHLLKGKGSEEDFGLHPIGTGPFRFKSWKDNQMVFEANKDYFLGRPYLDKIIIKIYPDQGLAWARLMRGDGDMFLPVDPSVYGFLKQVTSLKIRSQKLSYSMIIFNNNIEPFNDMMVRVALNYAIDKEYIIENVLKSKGEVAAGTIWPRSWFYNPSVKPYPYDPKKALALLREAGWRDRDGDHILNKDGKRFIFTIFINEGDEIKGRVAMYIQQQLWELGIGMNIKTVSAASKDFLIKGEFEAVFLDIFSDIYPDFNYNIWHSSQIGRGLNISRYRLGFIDDLLERGRVSRNTGEARELYNRFQEEINHNPPGIFLYWAEGLIGIHRRFRGVRFPPGRILTYINEWYVPEGGQRY